jgi:CDP-glucose 4,6-dehydratase
MESPIAVIDLVHIILGLMDKQWLEPRILNEATHEIYQQYLDGAKAKALLGWRPKYSLSQGLQETIAWYRDCLSMDKSRIEDLVLERVE